MRVVGHQHAQEFFESVEPFLLENEALNNLPLGIMKRLANDPESSKKELFFYHIEGNGEVKLVFMRTPPHLWIVSAKEDVTDEVLNRAIAFLREQKHEVPGVIGPKSIAKRFATQWEKATNDRIEVRMEQLIYQLTSLEDIPNVKGELVVAKPENEPLVQKWLFQFGKEADEPVSEEEAKALAKGFIEQESIHLWKVENEYVSMANRSRETKNGGTINAVFTPDKFKRKGYATSCVWKLTEKLLKQGKSFCSLYTDAANPTSNSIYQKIGYRLIGDSIMLHFTKKPN